jgi:nitrile hydratase accessory protein
MTDIDKDRQMLIPDNIFDGGATACSTFENLTFQTPWSARVFGITLAASESCAFTMREFQQALIERIHMHELKHGCINGDISYYSCWTEALAQLLHEKQLISASALALDEEKIRDALAALQHDHEHHHDDDTHAPEPLFVEGGR